MLGIFLAPAFKGYRFGMPQDIWDWVGTIVSVIGTVLVIMSIRSLKKAFTIDAAVKEEASLVMSFPFNLSRNPMYLGGLIMCFSWSLLQKSLAAAILSVLLHLVLHFKIKIEEKNLEHVFGHAYMQYKQSVGRYI